MWRWDRVFSEHFGFRLSASFHQFSAFMCTYMLLLPQVERGEVWEPFKQQRCFGNRVILERKVVYFLFRIWTLTDYWYFLHKSEVVKIKIHKNGIYLFRVFVKHGLYGRRHWGEKYGLERELKLSWRKLHNVERNHFYTLHLAEYVKEGELIHTCLLKTNHLIDLGVSVIVLLALKWLLRQ